MMNKIRIESGGTAVITQPKAAINVARMILIATIPPTHLLGVNDQNASRVRVIRMVSMAE